MRGMANRPVLKLVEDKDISLKSDSLNSVALDGNIASRHGVCDDVRKRFIGDLWSSGKPQMHSLHYIIHYKDSFKPEVPDFCIKRFSKLGDVVFDPFCGRGTTVLQANLLGRKGWGSDANPLAVSITKAKINPVRLDEVVLRLNEVSFWRPVDISGFNERFAPFYHPDTYRELINLRAFIASNSDSISRFIELLAISRLHGHSASFFSGYSFPHVSISPDVQRLVNSKRREVPDYRAVAPRIIKRAAQSVCDGVSSDFFAISAESKIQESDARSLAWIQNNSVDLIVTSPPLPDKVEYKSDSWLADNWLELWFTNANTRRFVNGRGVFESLTDWQGFMHDALYEMLRILKPQSHAVIEVKEVDMKNSSIVSLDDVVLEIARKVNCNQKQFVVEEVMVNKQASAKLSNRFKCDDGTKDTKINKLVVLKCVNSKWR